MNKKVSLISLGCAKNLVDSENVLALLGEKNFIITDSWKSSDIVIINTCAFIKEAVDESLGVIKEIVENKGERKVVVGGCLVQRFKEKVFEIGDIDGIVGTGDPEKFVEVVEELNEKEKIKKIDNNTFFTKKLYPRLITTFPYAYLKIAEGCDNRCSYCLIPHLRGRQRSKEIPDILKEAEDLLNSGI
ncbi:30S ribosomal protein S12 methylthiotransferase RimO, partial [bacterium]|nr:30S ribosomal protein S12 methylthiotransferase RimO [bacterium]